MNFLEDGSNVTAFIPNTVTQKLFTSDSLISEASASTTSDYSKRSPKTTGDTL
jgi:hypothetical protein